MWFIGFSCRGLVHGCGVGYFGKRLCCVVCICFGIRAVIVGASIVFVYYFVWFDSLCNS